MLHPWLRSARRRPSCSTSLSHRAPALAAHAQATEATATCQSSSAPQLLPAAPHACASAQHTKQQATEPLDHRRRLPPAPPRLGTPAQLLPPISHLLLPPLVPRSTASKTGAAAIGRVHAPLHSSTPGCLFRLLALVDDSTRKRATLAATRPCVFQSSPVCFCKTGNSRP
jgi:hypothetical protein